MGKSQKAVSQDVHYGNPTYNTPFGSWSGNEQNWTSTLSPEQKKQLDLSQSAYYDIMKQLPTDGPFGASSMNNFNNPNSYLGSYNQAYKDLMQPYVTQLNQQNAGQYGGDSTIGRYALNDLNTKIGNQGIMNSANLANTNYQGMLSGMTGVGASINDIFNRMMGIGNQGLGQQNSWLSNAQQNANRAYNASVYNATEANNNRKAMWNSLANLAGVGLLAGGNMFGKQTPQTGGGYTDAGQAYDSMFGGDITDGFGYQGNLMNNNGGGGGGNSGGGLNNLFGGDMNSLINSGAGQYYTSMMNQGSPSGNLDITSALGFKGSPSQGDFYNPLDSEGMNNWMNAAKIAAMFA